MRPVNAIIIHHSGRHDTLELIRQLHIDELGWEDVGYHYMVDRDGTIHQGRDESVVGAHAKGHNEGSLGICLLGDKDQEGMGRAQSAALHRLIDDISNRYPDLTIIGHRELEGVEKSCPGKNVDLHLIRDGMLFHRT